MSESPNFYAIIPANIRYADDLSEFQKLLYGEITALTDKTGYCWASNSYFANLYNKGIDWISKNINDMGKKGYIKIEVNSDCNQRKIFLGEMQKGVGKTPKVPIGENSKGDWRKLQGGIGENSKHNNTSITNINNNTSSKEEVSDLGFSEDFWKVFYTYEKHRKEKRSKFTTTARESFLKKCAKNGEEISIQAIQLSIDNGWTGVFFDKVKKNPTTEKNQYEVSRGNFKF